MKKQYAVVIEDDEDKQSEIKFFKGWEYKLLDLPDGLVIAIPPDATEDIRIAAQEAQNGNYDALMRATGEDENSEEE